MRVLAVIPARGGSKGVPRKNVKLLAGKPLIAYSIQAAQQSRAIELCLVSTDDPEISETARAFGADVLPRPDYLAEDTTSMPKVIEHVLEQRGAGFDILLLLQPTCPQRTSTDIDNALKIFQERNVQSVISVYQVEDHHPARMAFALLGDGTVVVEPDRYPERAKEILHKVADVRINDGPDLKETLGDTDAVVVRLKYLWNKQLLARAPQLKAIATATTGLDHIDLQLAESRGVTVLSLKGETEFLKTVTATAEHTWGLLLALIRHIPQAHRSVVNRSWERDRFFGTELQGRTLGIVGLGLAATLGLRAPPESNTSTPDERLAPYP